MPLESQIPSLISTDSRVSIGRFTYGNPKLMLWAESDQIEIGAFCSIAEEVAIFGGGEHRSDWVTTFPLRIAFGDPMSYLDGHPSNKGVTRIGNDVWIAFRVTILSGVTIGDGAIIGAGAIVSSDVPPYAIVAGSPAKVIKYRFSNKNIQKLLHIQWWNWEIEKIKRTVPLLCSTNIDQFILNESTKCK